MAPVLAAVVVLGQALLVAVALVVCMAAAALPVTRSVLPDKVSW